MWNSTGKGRVAEVQCWQSLGRLFAFSALGDVTKKKEKAGQQVSGNIFVFKMSEEFSSFITQPCLKHRTLRMHPVLGLLQRFHHKGINNACCTHFCWMARVTTWTSSRWQNVFHLHGGDGSDAGGWRRRRHRDTSSYWTNHDSTNWANRISGLSPLSQFFGVPELGSGVNKSNIESRNSDIV